MSELSLYFMRSAIGRLAMCGRGWLKVCFGVGLVICSSISIAQPGALYTNVMRDLQPGRAIALPAGQWQLLDQRTVNHLGVSWRTWVLRNTDSQALLPLLLVRVSETTARWRTTPCDTPNAQAFAVDRHGTMGVDPVGKCTGWWVIDSWPNFTNAHASSPWWAPVQDPVHAPAVSSLESLVLLDASVRRSGNYGVHVQAFFRPEPLGKSSKDLAQEYRMSPTLSAVHKWLESAANGIVNSVDESFFLQRQTRSMDVVAMAQGHQLQVDFSRVASSDIPNNVNDALRQAAEVGEAELQFSSANADHPLHPSRWGWHTSSNSFKTLLVPRDRSYEPSTTLMLDPFSPVVVPSDGMLVYKGPLDRFHVGWVIRHRAGLFSVISSPFSWDSEAPLLPGTPVTKGQYLANVRSANAVLLPVQWRLIASTDPVVLTIDDFDRHAKTAQAHAVGVKEGFDWVKRVLEGDEVNTKLLMDHGMLSFDFLEGLLPKDVELALNGTQLDPLYALANSYLLPTGIQGVSFKTGRIFKSERKELATVYRGGNTVQSIARSGSDIVFGAGSFIGADESQTQAVLRRLTAKPEPTVPVPARPVVVEPPVVASLPAPVPVPMPAPTPAAPTPVAVDTATLLQIQAQAQQQAEELRLLREQLSQLGQGAAGTAAAVNTLAAVASLAPPLVTPPVTSPPQPTVASPAPVTPPEVAVLAPNPRRKALVIGNDTYKHVPKLENARTDAREIGRALGRAGFNVTLGLDLTERGMKEYLRNFRMTVHGGDEVVVYFAGHGVQVNAANYLLPVDIEGQNVEQVRDEAIQLQRILDDMQDRRAAFMLAIVDACRDNPFAATGRAIGGRGLAPTSAATGQMIIFSAGTGQQALDRLGQNDTEPNGLFTRLFLREMEKPGVPIDRVLRSVRTEVARLAKSVGHEQTPALYDQSLGDFFFRPSVQPN